MLKKIILVVCGYFLSIGTFSAAFAASASASSEPDYYKILGVSYNATAYEIKKARDKQMIMHHTDKVLQNLPSTATEEDRGIAEEQANEKTKLINRAYEELSDVSKRANYDRRHRHDYLKEESHSRAYDRESFSAASASASSAKRSSEYSDSEHEYKSKRRPGAPIKIPGVVRSNFDSSDAQGQSVIVQQDGKLIVTGRAGRDMLLARYNANGTLDRAFGVNNDGVVKGRFGAYNAFGNSVIVQQDGKLIVTGRAGDDMLLARYNANGTLDRTFGINNDGVVKDRFGANCVIAKSVIVQQDGNLIVFGNAGGDLLLARYNADGTLDTTFGVNKNGVVKDRFGGNYAIGYSVIMQQDGKLVVAGCVGSDMLLVRYNANGTRDTTFGVNNDGVVQDRFGLIGEEGYSVIVQQDGKLVVAGFIIDNMFLARYNADGTLDEAFGVNNDGVVKDRFGANNAIGNSVIVQQDGKLIVTGYAGGDLLLARYNADGTLDTTFGINKNGVVKDRFGAGLVSGNSVIAQQDGKLIVTGNVGDDLLLVRYNANGTRDTTFGINKNGVVQDRFGASVVSGNSVIVQQDGKLVVVGYVRFISSISSRGLDYDMLLARYNADGTLDAAFGVPAQEAAQAGPAEIEAGPAQ